MDKNKFIEQYGNEIRIIGETYGERGKYIIFEYKKLKVKGFVGITGDYYGWKFGEFINKNGLSINIENFFTFTKEEFENINKLIKIN